ncbi:MAG TPA: PQQ-dependent sugar dehydrogenase [Candidatus Halomonas stercoripullorum]|uniref:PQQ-dependent sugar dehydrogenase n=1 Tax=Candidatus Halomonas stercoripullorum TaxID=2838617 RepID=A0A9D1WL82_9GAMM|nr:PQQ-dependent sugar dehydrogenase [Candidatus Halomonas stercoripullorum]
MSVLTRLSRYRLALLHILQRRLRLYRRGTGTRPEAGFLPEIYSWGHRHVLGLAVDPERNVVWAVEARNNGHDE